MKMAEVVVDECAGRVDIINHIGAPDSLSSIRLAKHAQEVGCSAIASLPPEYYFSHSEDEIFNYYKTLSDNCELPLLCYFTAKYNTGDISRLIERLMQLEHMIGMKFTRYNFFEMSKVLSLNGGDINVINGPDGQLVCGLLMGVDGGIGSTYNVMPREYVELFRRFKSGDVSGARDMQFKINRITAQLIKYDVVASIKYLLTYKGIDVGGPAFPGQALTEAQGNQLIESLKQVGYFDDFQL